MFDREQATDLAVDFYDGLAADYDLMTGRQGGAERVRRSLEGFVSRTGIRSAVDAGCGTGWHAVALAQLGLRVAAVDLSAEMISRARELAETLGVDVGWHVGNLTELDRLVGSGWDAVLCLGNTLPHLLRVSELQRFARAAYRTLVPDGILAVQCLNYELLQSKGERIVAITRHGAHEFVRFNDYLRHQVRFNLLQIDWTDEKPRYRLSHTILRPWRPDELRERLEKTGFGHVAVYADLTFTPFDSKSSRSFVLVARKGGSLSAKD